MNASRVKAQSKLPVFDPRQISSRQTANDMIDLLKVACEASHMEWGRLIPSILCKLPGRPLIRRRYSEYNVLNIGQPAAAARFLMDLAIPAFPESVPNLARMLLPPMINRRFWRPTHFFHQPDEYGGVCSFPDEHWFFINGIATNEDVARINSACLTHLFHRPVTVIQNATCSAGLDVLECVIGKGLRVCDKKIMTEPAWRAVTAILEALNADHTARVVVIAHSQGTIIMSNVLAAIEEALKSDFATQDHPKWHAFTSNLMGEIETENQKILRNSLAHALAEFTTHESAKVMARLKKLEIYTFANCADKMRWVVPSMKLPFMEHFANEFDWVARLGILSPLRGDDGAMIEIDGNLFEQKGEWGHLLNEHYLTAIDDHLYPGADDHSRIENPFPPSRNAPPKPRLYDYFHGKIPE